MTLYLFLVTSVVVVIVRYDQLRIFDRHSYSLVSLMTAAAAGKVDGDLRCCSEMS